MANVALITGTKMGGKQKLSWTSGIFKKAECMDTEKALNEKKKRDVVDTGHRNEDIEEVTEAQLNKGKVEEKLKTFEIQLETVRVKEPIEICTEGQLGDKHNEEAWTGDRMKIFELIDDMEEDREKANKKYHKKASKEVDYSELI